MPVYGPVVVIVVIAVAVVSGTNSYHVELHPGKSTDDLKTVFDIQVAVHHSVKQSYLVTALC